MKLYNTLTRKKEDFIPIEPNKVKMYVCGPTVYDNIHIGNARALVAFDAVRRYLEYKGYDVNYVSNFTDVDDKIINKANAQNKTMKEITEKYIKELLEDEENLCVKPSTHSPKVTEEIDEIIKMIETLINKGFAYEKNNTIFFDTQKFNRYGKLSQRNMEDLNFGSRIEVDSEKQNPADFVLWKPKKDGEEYFESPWGNGRPGWHIECSAMSKKYLGDTIDIHAGGEDLVFPHHENEIAQSEAASGKKFVNYWMHNGFITIDKEKMSKSTGNFFTVREVLKKFDGDVIRFFILSVHYRNPINFSEDAMEVAKTGLNRIKTCYKNTNFILSNTKNEIFNDLEKELIKQADSFRISFEEKMDDDFNTADAISIVFDFVRFINTNSNENSSKQFLDLLLDKLTALTNILAINLKEDAKINSDEIENLIAQRTQAKKDKDFKKADEIRDILKNMGIIIEDTRLGVKWTQI